MKQNKQESNKENKIKGKQIRKETKQTRIKQSK
jgi:hypothetical protein